MLSGVRPFTGTTALQLAFQHTTARPLLDLLPAEDRPVINRALAKVPEQRYRTCRELVEHLLRAGDPQGGIPPAARPAAGEPQRSPSPVSRVHNPLRSTPGDSLSPTDIGIALSPVARLTPVPGREGERAVITHPGRLTSRPLTGADAGIRPTLFLGVGRVAAIALRRLRQRLHARFGTLAAVPAFRLLLLDTDRATLREAQEAPAGEALEGDETLLTPLRPPEHYRPKAKTHLRWLERRWLYGIPRSLVTGGLRPLGRLALVDNVVDVLARVRSQLALLSSPEARATTSAATGRSLRAEVPRVFLVGSITGGTAGGMLPTLAFAVRQVLGDLRLPADGLCGILAYATSPKPAAKDMARVNAWATLAELNHFSRRENPYPGDPDYYLAPFGPGQVPLPECYLVHLGDDLNRPDVDAAAEVLAEYLYLDAVGGGGAFLDHYRQHSCLTCVPGTDGLPLRTFGLSRVSFPRQHLADLAADLFCTQLVERWAAKLDDPQKKQLEQEVRQQAAALGVGDPSMLVRKFCGVVEELLGTDPETCLSKILSPAPGDGPPSPAPTGTVPQAVARIHDFLGQGAGAEPAEELRPFEADVRGRAVAYALDLGRQLIDGLVARLDMPGKRLKAADCSLRSWTAHVGNLTTAVRSQLGQWQSQRRKLGKRLIVPDPAGKDTDVRPRPRGKPSDPAETRLGLVEYWRLRLGEIALENALRVLGRLGGALDAFDRDLVACGPQLTRLTQDLRRLAGEPGEQRGGPAAAPKLVELFPGRATGLRPAAEAVLKQLGPEGCQRVETAFQKEVLDTCGGLWALLQPAGSAPPPGAVPPPGTPGGLAWAIHHELRARAQGAVLALLETTDAASLFLGGRSEPEQVGQALAVQEQAARPRLAVPGTGAHLVLAAPASPSGKALRELLTGAVTDVPVTIVESEDDLTLCYEAAWVSVPQALEALTGSSVAAYAALAQRVLTRTDVAWTAFTPSEFSAVVATG
jgi:hypothetical protein